MENSINVKAAGMGYVKNKVVLVRLACEDVLDQENNRLCR